MFVELYIFNYFPPCCTVLVMIISVNVIVELCLEATLAIVFENLFLECITSTVIT